MIQRVYEKAAKAKILDRLIVATDDKRIYEHVIDFGGEAMMTSPNHKSGTDRCCEVTNTLKNHFEIVFNILGDEPFINPKQINLLVECFDSRETQIATLVKQIDDTEDLFNPGIPKVIINNRQEALYFSRQPIPFYFDSPEEKWQRLHKYYKHIGLYAFKSDVLKRVAKIKPSALEKAESLEQLRWLENGYKIRVALTYHDSHAIDTPDDLAKIE